MQDNTAIPFPHPQLTAEDPLTELLRQGAQRLLAQAIEAEVTMLLAQYADARPMRMASCQNSVFSCMLTIVSDHDMLSVKIAHTFLAEGVSDEVS
jgi:hypothetical protein